MGTNQSARDRGGTGTSQVTALLMPSLLACLLAWLGREECASSSPNRVRWQGGHRQAKPGKPGRHRQGKAAAHTSRRRVCASSTCSAQGRELETRAPSRSLADGRRRRAAACYGVRGVLHTPHCALCLCTRTVCRRVRARESESDSQLVSCKSKARRAEAGLEREDSCLCLGLAWRRKASRALPGARLTSRLW